jgi:hypothetical protein
LYRGYRPMMREHIAACRRLSDCSRLNEPRPPLVALRHVYVCTGCRFPSPPSDPRQTPFHAWLVVLCAGHSDSISSRPHLHHPKLLLHSAFTIHSRRSLTRPWPIPASGAPGCSLTRVYMCLVWSLGSRGRGTSDHTHAIISVCTIVSSRRDTAGPMAPMAPMILTSARPLGGTTPDSLSVPTRSLCSSHPISSARSVHHIRRCTGGSSPLVLEAGLGREGGG